MKVFISYRRKDAQYIADRIYGRLADEFGRDYVFMDTEGAFDAGRDFRPRLLDAVARCDALLAVIGPGWLLPIADLSRFRFPVPLPLPAKSGDFSACPYCQ